MMPILNYKKMNQITSRYYFINYVSAFDSLLLTHL